MQTTVQELRVQRVNVVTTNSFDEVAARIDAAIGHPDMGMFRKNLSTARNLDEMEKVVHPVTQPNGLMEFARFDLGEVLRKENATPNPKILRIVAGNPLIMKEMVKHVVDAGSYAPVTILIHERTDCVCISYDRMTSYLASYGDSDALKVAHELDAKVEKIIATAAE
jgi:uncharacterized protein (DUF302 family)